MLQAILLALLIAATVTTSTGFKNAQLDRAFNAAAGGQFNSGLVQFYSGTAPGATAAPTGAKLWEETMDADAFGAAASGQVSKNGTWQANAIATGTAGYFRIVKSGDLGTNNNTDERIEGDITATGGGGACTLQTTSITSGQPITINTATVTHG